MHKEEKILLKNIDDNFMGKMPISAIVTTYNEDCLLEECLSKLSFCDELLVVDLGSKDNSIAIAKNYATEVIKHERVPYVEKIIAKFGPTLRNEWIMHIDPDEVLDKKLIDEILKKINNDKSIAIIRVPWQFYFKNKRLKGTIWGGTKSKPILFNKRRVKFKDLVHEKAKILNGKEVLIDSEHVLHHYWMSSYSQLLEKHKRYIKAEGKKRFENNEKYSLYKKTRESTKALIKNLIFYKGFTNFQGIFLSFFYTWYVWQSNNSLKKYENNKK